MMVAIGLLVFMDEGKKMKMKTRYLILFIIDVLLIILWPIAVAAMTPAKWYAFIAGACWMSDCIDVVKHWKGYKAYKAMGE